MEDQNWFEMLDLRVQTLDEAVWIPLRQSDVARKEGRYGYDGYLEEFVGHVSLAVPIESRSAVEDLGWNDVGLAPHSPYVEGDRYVPADIAELGEVVGLNLVLVAGGLDDHGEEWLLHPDLVLGLSLRHEQEKWLSVKEGYEVVARLRRAEKGGPKLLEFRSEYLKDFLCARGMALYVLGYRSRRVVTRVESVVAWEEEDRVERIDHRTKWFGRKFAIEEGGMLGFGMTVFRAYRTDVDARIDVPSLGPENDFNVMTESWEIPSNQTRLFHVEGELYKNEWVEPGAQSPRIRGDKVPSSVQFIIDAGGSKRIGEELLSMRRWLWFRPDVVGTLISRRGGFLRWFTRDTGVIACAPARGVHFGVNSLGILNVYAKDIGQLPEWQQRIWAGFNVGPDGGVSEELLASQVRALPTATSAPEDSFMDGLKAVAQASMEAGGIPVIRPHDSVNEIVPYVHRFRAVDRHGLLSLAKDIARLTADSFDMAAIRRLLRDQGNKTNEGSLKMLERLLAERMADDVASEIMAPLHVVYRLRHGDAHLPSREIGSVLDRLGIGGDIPPIRQGQEVLRACAASLWEIADAIRQGPKDAD